MNAPTAAIVTRLSLKYVKASIIYLVAGSTLALLTFSDVLPFAITAFYFIQLYGFVAMMIFDLSYLFIPAFSHATLHSLRLARLQFWLMNIGVIGMAVSFSGVLPNYPTIRYFAISSFVVQVLALYLHAFNVWRTLQGWKGSPGEKLAIATAKS